MVKPPFPDIAGADGIFQVFYERDAVIRIDRAGDYRFVINKRGRYLIAVRGGDGADFSETEPGGPGAYAEWTKDLEAGDVILCHVGRGGHLPGQDGEDSYFEIRRPHDGRQTAKQTD